MPDNLQLGTAPELAPEAAVIQALLLQDERVRSVSLECDLQGRLVAKVAPAQAWLVAEREATHSALSRRMLRQWKMVYDRAYRIGETVRAPGFDAWISSFTGTAIPQERMRAWLESTLAWLQKVPHARVLDIGCGVGLVLEALAPNCVEYQGIDISATAIKSLAAWVATQPNLRHVTLATLAAHELEDVTASSLDLVVLNSVAMYFPDPNYLLTVLRAASERLAPGGRIFLGDLRALGPLPVLAAAIEMARVSQSATVGEVRSQVAARLGLMHELAIDTTLFAGLAAHLPRLSDIRFGLKPANSDPELSGYRYDVMLTFDGPQVGTIPPQLAWNPAWTGVAELLTRLVQDAPDALVVEAIPNARLAHDLAMSRYLDAAPAEALVADLRHALASETLGGVEPSALTAAVGALGYSAELRFTAGSREGRFDVLLFRPGVPHIRWPLVRTDDAPANDPLGAELVRALTMTLQQSVDTTLGKPGLMSVVLELPAESLTLGSMLN